jgi:rhamnose utilization protein RhaD (predicted bifunctional aldolase and dehydrogenase)/NAD(P)-dependent dehydrogenase (short-subunit alcohol dehydrogenase family)
MHNLWNDSEAAACADDLALRVYSSQLLGKEPALVLAGGGNTSVKLTATNVFGETEELLYVKGSGGDLATISAAGFAPVRMTHLLRLAELPKLSDSAMARELRTATVDPHAPNPSVEAILHAILPYRFVDHTHADAFIALCNTPNGEQHVRSCYGDKVLIVPYVMPGFALARTCAELLAAQLGPQIVGVALMNHGLFTFGNTARQAYDRMIDLVTQAETYVAQHNAWELPTPNPPTSPTVPRREIANLRRKVALAANAPMLLKVFDDPVCLAFANHPDLTTISQQGPATPDHVIRTKRLPLLGRDVALYAAAYRQYFQQHATPGLTMLDPAPRILLDPQLGMLSAGRSVSEVETAATIYRHTISIIQRAERLGGWRALSAAELFEVEYWELEQAKLKRAGPPRPFAGEVALVTGAASGIGEACVEALLARGAAVIAVDRNPAITTQFQRPEVLGIAADVSNETAINAALDAGVKAFGGLDLLILNAGVFSASQKIASLTLAEWQRTMQINLDANLTLLRECHPLLKLALHGGRVVIIGSKNVPAPGPGAAAYSASKAALTQLARVAALEWGTDNIRVNVLHPNAVFDTGIWSEEVLQTRAENYGMTVEEYRTNNLLRVEVLSRDVAELAAELCGPLFAKTTGAQIPIDGGNDRVI